MSGSGDVFRKAAVCAGRAGRLEMLLVRLFGEKWYSIDPAQPDLVFVYRSWRGRLYLVGIREAGDRG